jgi:hypothetical protein
MSWIRQDDDSEDEEDSSAGGKFFATMPNGGSSQQYSMNPYEIDLSFRLPAAVTFGKS